MTHAKLCSLCSERVAAVLSVILTDQDGTVQDVTGLCRTCATVTVRHALEDLDLAYAPGVAALFAGD